MANKKPTLRDVAKRAKVPEATVKKVLDYDPAIPEDKKIRVLKAINDLNYHHDVKKLDGASNTIALVAPFFYSPFISQIVDGIEHKLVGTQYNASQYSTKGVLENERSIFQRILRTGMADAFILFNIPVDEDILNEIRKRKIPVVSMERELPFFATITTDNMHGSYMGTKHLIKGGKKNIAIVIGKRYQPDIQNDRIKGYMKALEDSGLPFNDDSIVVINEHDFENGKEIYSSFFKQRPEVDGIFCMAGDIVATGIISEAKKNGVRIPEDIAVIGYDDLEIAQYITPSLTTIRQPTRKMGEKAVEIVLEALETKSQMKSMEIVFKTELIVRESAK
jgi:DNA-binding LacI/PurR family transcriptional regulator